MLNNRHRSRTERAARAALVVASFALAACGDSPVAPQQSIDRVAAARVVPSVVDARLRVAAGVENIEIRGRMTHDLTELERSLINGDGQKARFHVRLIGDVMIEYRRQQGVSNGDGADITAVLLALHAVSAVVDARFELPLSN